MLTTRTGYAILALACMSKTEGQWLRVEDIMKRLNWGILVILLFVFVTQTQAQYWRGSFGDHVVIYQWPYDGTLGGDPETNTGHFLNYVPNHDYTYLDGPLYNGYLTFALGQAVSELEVTLTSSTSMHHNWINDIHTSTGSGLSGDLLTSDSHFMLDPLGLGVGYNLIDQYESPTEISFHVFFNTPVDFFAANLVGMDASAFSGFMEGIDYFEALIIGDGVEFDASPFVPEPATLSLLSLGGLILRKKHCIICG